MGQHDELVDQHAVENALDPDAMAEAYDGGTSTSAEAYDEHDDGDVNYELDVDDVLEDGSLVPAERL
jgi:hypothetical protein